VITGLTKSDELVLVRVSVTGGIGTLAVSQIVELVPFQEWFQTEIVCVVMGGMLMMVVVTLLAVVVIAAPLTVIVVLQFSK
jgi:hypothetical protein